MNTKSMFQTGGHDSPPNDDKNAPLTAAQIRTLAAVNELGGWNTARGISAAGGANACLSALVRKGLLVDRVFGEHQHSGFGTRMWRLA
jgi:hypothetical protein